jgi:hypothetical protein
MKKLFVYFIFFVGSMLSFSPETTPVVNAEKETPSHARWGKLAMEKTKERYPNSQIYDYLHVGREKRLNSSVETFKLWVKEKDRKFEVFVHIEFDTNTEKVLNVNFKEVSK